MSNPIKVIYYNDYRDTNLTEDIILEIDIECPIYIKSIFQRHGMFTFIYENHTNKNAVFYYPPTMQFHSKDDKENEALGNSLLKSMIHEAQRAYRLYIALLDQGVVTEIAESVLPQSTMSKFLMSGKINDWVSLCNRYRYIMQEFETISDNIEKIIMKNCTENKKV